MSEISALNLKRGNVKGALVSKDQSSLDERRKAKMTLSRIAALEAKVEFLEQIILELKQMYHQRSQDDPRVTLSTFI